METTLRSTKETSPADKDTLGDEAAKNDASPTIEKHRKADASIESIKEEFSDATVFLDHVRERAYQIWSESGRTDGQEVDHWLQAEREVTVRLRSNTRS